MLFYREKGQLMDVKKQSDTLIRYRSEIHGFTHETQANEKVGRLVGEI